MAEPTPPRAAKLSSPRSSRRQAAAEFEAENDASTVALFEELRRWRGEVASSKSVPAYSVFADSTLRLIAILKPSTLPQLSAVHGVGPVKLAEYGDALLRVVREHHSS